MPTPDALTEMAVEAVANNPALQSRVSEFVSSVLDMAEDIIDHGTPKMQADIVGKLVPHLVKQLADKAEDDQIRAMREAHNELREAMRKAIERPVPEDGYTDEGQARVDAVLDTIPKDQPPASVTDLTPRIQVKGS